MRFFFDYILILASGSSLTQSMYEDLSLRLSILISKLSDEVSIAALGGTP
jgi:hypothetical protein